MSKYFEIEGYWKDDKSEFSGIIKEYDDFDEEEDEEVFFFGMNENEIIEAIKAGEDTTLDFVITSYKIINNMKKVTINIPLPLNENNMDATEFAKRMIENPNFDLFRFRFKDFTYRDTTPPIFIGEMVVKNEENPNFESIFDTIPSDYVLVAESEDGTYTLHLNNSKGVQHSDCEIEKFYYLLD